MWIAKFWWQGLGVALVGLAVSGCGPQIDPKDLGHLIYKLPELPGSKEPYPVPPLEQSETRPPAAPAGPRPN